MSLFTLLIGERELFLDQSNFNNVKILSNQFSYEIDYKNACGTALLVGKYRFFHPFIVNDFAKVIFHERIDICTELRTA